VAELCAPVGARADLHAEIAGILEGASEGEQDEPCAHLCRAAVPTGRGPARRRYRLLAVRDELAASTQMADRSRSAGQCATPFAASSVT
jgi:hypothetical protein